MSGHNNSAVSTLPCLVKSAAQSSVDLPDSEDQSVRWQSLFYILDLPPHLAAISGWSPCQPGVNTISYIYCCPPLRQERSTVLQTLQNKQLSRLFLMRITNMVWRLLKRIDMVVEAPAPALYDLSH